jgi:hypothetical protein
MESMCQISDGTGLCQVSTVLKQDDRIFCRHKEMRRHQQSNQRHHAEYGEDFKEQSIQQRKAYRPDSSPLRSRGTHRIGRREWRKSSKPKQWIAQVQTSFLIGTRKRGGRVLNGTQNRHLIGSFFRADAHGFPSCPRNLFARAIYGKRYPRAASPLRSSQAHGMLRVYTVFLVEYA